MAKAQQFIGIAWVASCAALWFWIGFFTPTPDLGGGWLNWTMPRMIADSRFGLTFAPILLAIPGAWLWLRGKRAS